MMSKTVKIKEKVRAYVFVTLSRSTCLGHDKLFKGTNGRQKTYEISHVYSIFYSGFMCQTTVIFGITKDGSLY